MRNFHVHPNNANLCQPGINLDKLWSLVTEQVGQLLNFSPFPVWNAMMIFMSFLTMNPMIISMIGLMLLDKQMLMLILGFVHDCLNCKFQYYAIFDNPATRGELAKLYNTEQVSAGSLSWQYNDEY